MKTKTKKQAVKKQPNESKEFKNMHIELHHDVFCKLKNASDITGRSYKQIVDQALRNLLKMQTPTIEEEIKNLESK